MIPGATRGYADVNSGRRSFGNFVGRRGSSDFDGVMGAALGTGEDHPAALPFQYLEFHIQQVAKTLVTLGPKKRWGRDLGFSGVGPADSLEGLERCFHL